MMKLWKKALLLSVGLAVVAYEELKKSTDRLVKEARQAAQRAT